MGARATGSAGPRRSAARPRAGSTGSRARPRRPPRGRWPAATTTGARPRTSSVTAPASATTTSTRSHGSRTCTSVYPAPGSVRLLRGSSRAYWPSQCCQAITSRSSAAEHEHVSVCSARGGDRRRLRADRAGRDVPGERGRQARRRGSGTATGRPSGTAGARRRRSRRPCGTADRRPRSRCRWSQSTSCCQSARTTLLADEEPRGGRDRQVRGQQDAGAAARLGGSPRGQPGVAQARCAPRPRSWRAATSSSRARRGCPPATWLVSSVQKTCSCPSSSEPQPVGLEVRRHPCEQRHDAQHAEQQRGAHARPPPPAVCGPRPGGAVGVLAVLPSVGRPAPDRARVGGAGPH